jgi:hypothetical protein
MLEGMLCFLTDVSLARLALLWACCAFLVKLHLFILDFDHLLFVVFVIKKITECLMVGGGHMASGQDRELPFPLHVK